MIGTGLATSFLSSVLGGIATRAFKMISGISVNGWVAVCLVSTATYLGGMYVESQKRESIVKLRLLEQVEKIRGDYQLLLDKEREENKIRMAEVEKEGIKHVKELEESKEQLELRVSEFEEALANASHDGECSVDPSVLQRIDSIR